ncbi:MAG: hypothetical protein HKN87_02890 [Saprospiraceae bacterium]|nr:hypothetical protein [Saprospiraceae bacterium]
MSRLTTAFTPGLLIILFLACHHPQPTNSVLSFSTKSAPYWDQVFKRTSGWFGGDGIFFIPQEIQGTENKGKQLILFSDTMVGEISDGKLKEGFQMINNSVAELRKDTLSNNEFQFPIAYDSTGTAKSIFPVKLDHANPLEYYWLGDGFQNKESGKTHIFAYRVIDRPELKEALFKFEVLGGALITLPAESQYPYEIQVQKELPFFRNKGNGTTSFGAGILADVPGEDEYVYVYGVRDPGKQLIAARVNLKEFTDFSEWAFYAGGSWSNNFEDCVSITDSVSNELSVSPLPNGQFALVFQINGIQPQVGLRLGISPVGPFGPTKEIWDCSEALEEPEFFAYNAKAHPSISSSDELIISYNVNSFKFWDQINDHPQLYRPRFFILSWK